jgi:hypothetical protein
MAYSIAQYKYFHQMEIKQLPIKATFQWNICFKNIVISDLPLKHNQ